MGIKDWFALAMAVLGIASAVFNYIIYWQGRKDIYEGDFKRAEVAWRWGTVVFQMLMVCIACWVVCIVDGIA